MPATVRATQSQWSEFRARCSELAGRPLDGTTDLHDFSLTSPREFWRLLLEWSGLEYEGDVQPVLTDGDVETARFFPNVRLNYTENLLRPLPDVEDAPALVSRHLGRPTERLTRRELRSRVRDTATALAGLGISATDRVVLVAPNTATAVVTALGVTALGATLSTATPDVGVPALLGRFGQVEPVVLLLDRAGMPGDAGERAEALAALLAGLPTVQHLVLLDDGTLPDAAVAVARLTDLVDRVAADPDLPPAAWPRLPFDHPLFAMFSSGTTGPPKAIVHGIGGTVLEHVKEHRLHGDLRPDDVLYFHTTTAWMMWNWQLSALAVGATIVVYDGPVQGPPTLWTLVAEEGVTVFGTSPAYLQVCQDADYRPREAVALDRLRAVLSTGAVLHPWQFEWVLRAVGDVPVQSISGGTDIIGCFVLGHPDLPVVPGWCQTRSLGMDVAAVDDAGNPVVGRIGELVCRSPFPSRPVHFLRDPDGSRFHQAYFAAHPGMWTHGDLVEFTPEGAARLHGRSDGVLNVNGVRIGPAEVYRPLHHLSEVAEALAVEQRVPDTPGETRMVLLLVLRDGHQLTPDLEWTIRTTLRREASAAHVPSVIAAVPQVPTTHNGKRSERAARDAVNGDPVANTDALSNPASIAAIRAAVEAAERRQPAQSWSPDGADGTGTAVARIWGEILGGRAGGPDDSFFDLGGTSRESISLLRRIRSEMGREVPMDDFVAVPTLRGLIAAVAAGSGSPGRDDVVVLAEGDPSVPPVVFFHDAWGDVHGYRTLAARLTTTARVLGVRATLEDADGRPLTFAEVVAADVERLLAAVPQGPFRLAGFSFGGLVAFEVARTLAEAGHEVSFLGLVDVRSPLAALPPAHRRLRRTAERAAFLLPGFSENTLREFLRDHLRPQAQPEERRVLFRSARVYDAHEWGPYAGPVTYFRARRRIPVFTNQLYAWRTVAPALTVVDVPGAHHTLLTVANAPVLARRMSEALGD